MSFTICKFFSVYEQTLTITSLFVTSLRLAIQFNDAPKIQSTLEMKFLFLLLFIFLDS